ncbi:hypothetical protein Tco_0081175, partial [Tanacetum coccineum]
MKASLQGKDNVIQKLKMQISQLKETRSELDRTLDFRARDFQISQLTKKVNGLQEQNELFRAENAKIKQHYKELYDSILRICVWHLSKGVNSCTDASGSQPRSILKKHRIPPAKSDSLKKVEDHLRTIRSSLKTTNRVDSSISSKRT